MSVDIALSGSEVFNSLILIMISRKVKGDVPSNASRSQSPGIKSLKAALGVRSRRARNLGQRPEKILLPRPGYF
jgi:hypothetical protein